MREKHKLISAILCVCFLVGTLPQFVVPAAASSGTLLSVTAPTLASVMVGYGQPEGKPIAIKNTGSGWLFGVKAEVIGDSFMLTGPTNTLSLGPGVTDTSYSVRPKTGLSEGTYTATITVTANNGDTATTTVSLEVKPANSIVNPPDGVPAVEAPRNLTELRNADPAEVAKAPKFDSRDYDIVPPTKDQGYSDICWAYAPITASTISILRSGIDPSASKDSLWLSPEVLAYSRHNHPADPLGNTTSETTSKDWFSSPGDIVYTPALLSQWCGPVVSNQSLVTNPNIDPFANAAYKMETAVNIKSNQLRTDEAARNAIKEAIVRYGAVTFSYNNRREVQYYNPTGELGSSPHACTIIGWDDTIPASKFQPGEASQPGGWLVKNSYDSLPYFWLSYDCQSPAVWAFDYAPADRYDYNYFYDSNSEDFLLSASMVKNTAANVFQAKKGTNQAPEYLKAVNVGFYGENVHCEVQVYTDLSDPSNPESGRCVATLQGNYELSGFYTLQLEQPVALAPGSHFSVVVRISNNDSQAPYIRAGLNLSSGSYTMSSSGLWGKCIYGVRIKAFTKLGDPGETPKPTTDISSAVVTLMNGPFAYTGNPITPDCTVTVNNQILTADTDYVVSYSDNINVGTAAVTVTGTGSYHGSVTKTFAITRASFTADVSLSGWTYGQKANEPSVSGQKGGGAVTYWYAASENGAYSTTRPTDAGTYYVKAHIAETSNYNACTTAPVLFIINKADKPSNFAEVPQTVVLKHNESLSNIALPGGWSWSNPNQTIAPGEVVSVTAQYSDQTNYQTATVDVQVIKEQSPAPALTPEATPAATIDYAAEVLRGLEALGTYKINGVVCTIGKDGVCAIDPAWFGNTLAIIKVGNGTTTQESAPQTLMVPNRPAAPQNITVKHEDFAGDCNGQIIGVSIAMEYQISGSSSWTACVRNPVTSLAPGTYLIRVKATGNSFAGLSATVRIRPGGEQPTDPVLTPEATPAATIDYIAETLCGMGALGTYEINGAVYTIGEDGICAIDPAWFGNALTIVKVGNGATTQNSAPQTLMVPNRPAAPQNITVIDEDFADNHNGQISGVSGAMEYQISGSGSWTACVGDPVTNLAPGMYLIRTKADDHSFAGLPAIVSIQPGEVPTYTLTLTTPVFSEVTAGYQQPKALPIIIKNSGNHDATISSVLLSGKDAGSFTLSAGDSVVASGAQNASYLIQPKGDLPAGSYTAQIVINYDGGAQVQAEISFTVRVRSEQPVPTPGGNTSGIVNYSIQMAPSAHGTIAFSTQNVPQGTKVTLTVSPDTGYALRNLTLQDSSGGAIALTKESDTVYTFVMPASTVTIAAVFAEIKPQISFIDVSSDAYYFDAVTWAIEKGITMGTSATTFSPDAVCTRAQMVTFLWRAAGRPEPSAATCNFTDVDKDGDDYQAILWAAECGITMGTSETTFQPDVVCSRGQMATFLYRYSGSPTVTGTHPFTDVAKNADAHDTVTWAVQNGVTKGTSATTFSPLENCTRGQMITFLYRLQGIHK